MIGEILAIVVFVLLGIVLSLGKWTFLIAGFNAKDKEGDYYILALSKFIGKFMFIIAFCILLLVLSDVLFMELLLYISIAIFSVSIIFVIIYVTTGERFKKKSDE